VVQLLRLRAVSGCFTQHALAHKNCTLEVRIEKGKPGESRRRKAMDLQPRSRGYDRQAAGTLVNGLNTIRPLRVKYGLCRKDRKSNAQ
jgi:hypothetical protein